MTLRPRPAARHTSTRLVPAGRSLGLRPLGFRVGVGRAGRPRGRRARCAGRAGRARRSRRAVAFGGFRFGATRACTATGGAARLRVAVSDGRSGRGRRAPGSRAALGDLVLALEQYFPDFALDEKPAAASRARSSRATPRRCSSVARGGQRHRAFVMRSMPGVHRVEPLGLSFSLLDVEPEAAGRDRRAPASRSRSPCCWAASCCRSASRSARARSRRTAASLGAAGPLVAGAGLLAALLLVDSGGVLAWSFGVAGPRRPPAAAGRRRACSASRCSRPWPACCCSRRRRLAGGVDVARGRARVRSPSRCRSPPPAWLWRLVRVVSWRAGPRAGAARRGLALAARVLAALSGRRRAGPASRVVVPSLAGLLVAAALGRRRLVDDCARQLRDAAAPLPSAAAAAPRPRGAARRRGSRALRRLALLLAVLALLARPS